MRAVRITFRGRLHDARTATAVGRWLGLTLTVCFVTGLISHVLQEPPDWLQGRLPTRPLWGYQLTQGVHVASGIATIPLLLVKLWCVYPRLFCWPPVRSVRHAVERLSIAVLLSAALLEVFLGLVNLSQWYVWPFSFRRVHWALAWVLFGSLLLHLAVKYPQIARSWRRRRGVDDRAQDAEAGDGASATDEADRRSLMLGVGAAVGAVTLVTAGQSFVPLRPFTLLAPRRPDIGSQGLPVNRTARAARITTEQLAGWRLEVHGPRPYELTLPEVGALPQSDCRLPITCVEGWSAWADWSGVRLSDLLDLADAPHGALVRVESLQRSGAFRSMVMGSNHARDPLTLLALRINGQTLNADHGFPARIIAPNRPGVWQTKWVTRIEVRG